MKNINSELELNKKFNKNYLLSEIDNYINKLMRRLRDKQVYIKYLITLLKENNIDFNKEKFKKFKKSLYVDKYFIEKEELTKSPILNSKEAPEKVKDPESNSMVLCPGEKMNFYPPIEVKIQGMCERTMVAVESDLGIPKIKKGIIGEPKGLGVGEVSFIKENVEFLRSPYSISSGVDEKQEQLKEENEEKQEEDEEIKEIKDLISKFDYKELNKRIEEIATFNPLDIKNLLNYMKRKMKKNKGGFDKLEYMSFKAALEMLCENANA